MERLGKKRIEARPSSRTSNEEEFQNQITMFEDSRQDQEKETEEEIKENFHQLEFPSQIQVHFEGSQLHEGLHHFKKFKFHVCKYNQVQV